MADLQANRQDPEPGTALKVERAADLEPIGQALQLSTIPENERALDPLEIVGQPLNPRPA